MALPNRQCGGCTVCCTVLPIQSDGLEKQSGVACPNLFDSGCSIYDKRPRACRAFLCGWRELAFIPDELRPDQCGVLIVADQSDIPPGYRKMPGVKFVITDRAALSHEPFLETLAGLIEGHAPTFLAIPGPPGHFFAKAFLNVRLAEAVAALDANAITATLTEIADELAKGPFDPVVFNA